MTNGMVREVDRAIGALSALFMGVGMFMLRELYRSVRDNHDKYENCGLDQGIQEVYYHKKYEMSKLPLFQHQGGCECGSLRFVVFAPKRVEAFDDSNTFSCKKGRFPFVIVPTSCFEMMESLDVSLYESKATSCQHVFCAKCGIHIFQFDHTQPDCVAINLYCIDDENFEDIKVRVVRLLCMYLTAITLYTIIFIPKGSRPLFGQANRMHLEYQHSVQAQGLYAVQEDNKESTIVFQKQMMMWARMDNYEKYREPLSDDTRSSTSSTTQSRRFSFASSEDATIVTKDQLEFYLKRHLDDAPQEECRV